jgi:hypothetical protein
MKPKYTKTFSISANTHNIDPHDAILLTSNSVNAGVGASFSAEVHTYAPNTKLGGNQRPYGTDGITGNTIILRGTKSGAGATDPQTIFPIQIKSVSGITGANLYGLL